MDYTIFVFGIFFTLTSTLTSIGSPVGKAKGADDPHAPSSPNSTHLSKSTPAADLSIVKAGPAKLSELDKKIQEIRDIFVPLKLEFFASGDIITAAESQKITKSYTDNLESIKTLCNMIEEAIQKLPKPIPEKWAVEFKRITDPTSGQISMVRQLAKLPPTSSYPEYAVIGLRNLMNTLNTMGVKETLGLQKYKLASMK